MLQRLQLLVLKLGGRDYHVVTTTQIQAIVRQVNNLRSKVQATDKTVKQFNP